MKLFLITCSIVFVFSCQSNASKSIDKELNSVQPESVIKTDTLKPMPQDSLNITKEFVLGKFNYKTDTTFTKVSATHSAKTLYLHKNTYNAFLEMYNAAKEDGIELIILSGTRNFDEQKVIWERKWNKYKNLKPKERALKILEYSSMPSSSRHHWGTDFDLNSLTNSYFSSGKGKAVYDWLSANANNYGFFQVYTDKDHGRTGYNLEKWHWSYLPLASQYLNYYNTNITSADISEFKGAELAEDLHIIVDYVNGISEKAKQYK